MAKKDQQNEEILYVGDSRVRQGLHDNTPADYSSYPGKSEAFVPNFLLKEWMVGAVFLVGFMMLIISSDPPLGYPADPTNTSFIPIPDWYFLFMYQLLKYPYMSESYLVFGTVAIPGLLFGGLMLAPFLDRGEERRWFKRPIASSLMLVTLVAVGYLTWVSNDWYQNTIEEQGVIPEHIERAEKIERGEIDAGAAVGREEEKPDIVGEDSEGYAIYQQASCLACHATDLDGSPSLIHVGDRYSRDEIENIVREGLNTMDPQWDLNIENNGLTEEQMHTLVDWLATQKADAADDEGESADDAADLETA